MQTTPSNLFSHSDQQEQWQRGQSFAGNSMPSVTGWGGRVADLQPGGVVPMALSVAGNNVFMSGVSSQGLVGRHRQQLRHQGLWQHRHQPAVLALPKPAHPAPCQCRGARGRQRAEPGHQGQHRVSRRPCPPTAASRGCSAALGQPRAAALHRGQVDRRARQHRRAAPTLLLRQHGRL